MGFDQNFIRINFSRRFKFECTPRDSNGLFTKFPLFRQKDKNRPQVSPLETWKLGANQEEGDPNEALDEAMYWLIGF